MENNSPSVEDTYRIISLVEKDQNVSQRDLAGELGYSLGKVNYLMQALVSKGIVKLENFAKSDNKLAYRYVLTPEGVKQKYTITREYLQRKEAEYEILAREIETARGMLALHPHAKRSR